MTEDQFKHLLEQNNATLMERFDARLAEKLEQNNTSLFGQLSRHFDERFEGLHDELTTATDRIYAQLDGITKRLDDDDSVRAAISAEQERHSTWIGQVAKATGTKLVPEA